MVVELEDSIRVSDLEAPIEDVLLEERGEGGFCDEGGVGIDVDVVGDVGCTPTKECKVETYFKAYAKQQGFGVIKAAWSGYKAKDKSRKCRNAQWTCDRFGKPDRRRKVSGKRCVTDSQIEEDSDSQIKEDSSVKTSKKCKCSLQIYASVSAEMNGLFIHCCSSQSLKVAQIHNMLAGDRNGL
ncbi:Mucin-2 [Bienertia sinuspersici]